MKNKIKEILSLFLYGFLGYLTIYAIITYLNWDFVSLRYIYQLNSAETHLFALILLINISLFLDNKFFEKLTNSIITFYLIVSSFLLILKYFENNEFFLQALYFLIILTLTFFYWKYLRYKHIRTKLIIKIISLSIFILVFIDLLYMNQFMESYKKIYDCYWANCFEDINFDEMPNSIYVKSDTTLVPDSLYRDTDSIEFMILDPVILFKILDLNKVDSTKYFYFYKTIKTVHLNLYFEFGKSEYLHNINIIEKFYKDYNTMFMFDTKFYMLNKRTNKLLELE